MATKASRIALAGSNISSTGEVDADLLDNIDSAAFLSLDGSGNLGIGTSSPDVKLHVDGAGSQPEIRVSQNSTYFTDYGVNHIDVNGPNDLRFLMGGSEKVRITSDGYIQANSQSQVRLTLGNVGTPGTNNANWIRGTGNSLGLNAASDNIHFEIGGSEKFKISASGGALFNNGQDINQNFHVKSSGNANSFFIDGNGGKVGIGTTNPIAPLNVSIPPIAAGTDLQKQGIVVTTPFTSGYQNQSSGLLSGYDGTLHGTAIGMAYEDPGYALTFFTNDNTSGLPIERMRINDNGRLGIGTTDPAQMLHIAGSSPQIMLEDTDASGTPYSKISGVNGHIYLQADEANELANTAIHFKVDAQEHMTLYDNGMLSLNYGTNAGWEGATSMPSLIINQSDTHRGIALRTVGNSNVGPTFSLERTRGSGAETQHADYLGNIRFNATSGSYTPRVAAGIEAQQRGSVVGGYAPGRLKFMTASTTATHNGQNPSTGAYVARMVINPGGDQLINGQFNYHVISGTSAPNVAFQYDFYRGTYAHPMKITTAISHWNGGYMSYKEQWVWGFNTAMSSRTVDEYNGGNGSWTVSFPTNDIVRVRMNGDASYAYGSGWYIKLEGNLRREYTTA